MKRLLLVFFALAFHFVVFSQEALWHTQQIKSPEVNENNSVTFRFYAPNAETVQLTGDFLPRIKKEVPGFGTHELPGVVDLIKNEDGVWSYTSSVLADELYSYSFIVDGLTALDPNNVFLVRDVRSLTNLFLIDGPQSKLYRVNNVAHGSVIKQWYYSDRLQLNRRLTVYTPPGYNQSNYDYPVLYLLHGMGGDEEAWMTLGRASQILDNLIAEGKAEPMLVVMPNGNVSQEAAPGESSLGFSQPNTNLPKTMEGSMEESFLDIVTFIENNYRVKKEKKSRAIAGLSMGGFHSLHISKEYPDMFNYVGLFSAAIFPREGANSPVYSNIEEKLKVQFDSNPSVYWIAIGKTDFLYEANKNYRSYLDEKKYSYTYYESEGGHTWRNWRIYLSKFIPMLFK
ncbi:MAG: alpha/beta hydrolase-fold protein [Bacteroides sp.]|nr:alpha/beta hydrolase-fold protein [Bacteroides sp.]MDD4055910.1 alpha/beta hydrolase-fold protein [Bacteroides sp.]MDD4720147.1 alpha/beta hydrolase-fold protein [Bacteroides sp.]NLI63629.1 esterase [Bacteroidales bacterium]